MMVRSWRYVHDDVYGDLSLAVCRLTLHPWQLAPMVQNTVLTDRSRNHPGVRSLIGIRSMSMIARPRRGSLGNPRPLLSINKEPTSFEMGLLALGLSFGLSFISLYF
ncbi:hypothetical protein YC2023_108009 [Brassica napus]